MLILIDGSELRKELERNHISIRSLGDKKSNNYIGLSEKTIHRAIKNNEASSKTLVKLSKVIDVSNLSRMDDDCLTELLHLREENRRLKQIIKEIRSLTIEAIIFGIDDTKS